MMKINQYKLKDNVNISDLLEDGFTYSINMRFLSKEIYLKNSVIIWIKVSLTNLKAEIEVIDDNWLQYYTPFYDYQEGNIKGFKFLNQIIDKYNEEMSKLKCFEMEEK